jgi:hypothetical protein
LIVLVLVIAAVVYQVLKRSQRALKGSVSHTMLQPDFKGMTSVVPDSSKADLQRNPDEGAEAAS